MDHNHDHEYMHANGIPHEHTCDHDNAEGHAHCGGNCASCSGDPKAELIALMRYMANHNAAHANELATMAKRLNEMGERIAYEQVMAAVSDYEKGNMRLNTVLAALDIK